MSEPTLYDLYRSKKLPKEMQKQLDKIYEESISHDLGLFMVGYHIRGMAAAYTEEELKEENKKLQERYNKVDIIGYDALKELTKAKEILLKLLEEEKNNMYWEMNGSDKSSYYEVRKQAEQFLQEIEK